MGSKLAMMLRRVSFSVALAMATLFSACGHAPPKKAAVPGASAFELVSVEGLSFDDDLPAGSLIAAVDESLKVVVRKNHGADFVFGDRTVSTTQIAETLSRLREIFAGEPDPQKRRRMIAEEFEAYTRVETGGSVNVTGYYQPVLKGSRSKNGVFVWPIYRAPDDLVTADLGLFHSELAGKKITGRVENKKLLQYHDRAAIDGGGALADKGLEIAWVADPFDLFILHVQGSGVVEFEDGSGTYVNYSAVNGHAYRSVGRILVETGEISAESQSINAIRKWLDSHPDKADWLLHQNKSYVFFREMNDGPFGSTGAKLVAGRSAAFDPAFFPEGGAAWMVVNLPELADGEMSGVRKTARFVFNHDRGGAIKGPGRADMFMGQGKAAADMAGYMKQDGTVVFLIKKSGQAAERH
jgi:membrane-bound lytic murein transglycosylase A